MAGPLGRAWPRPSAIRSLILRGEQGRAEQGRAGQGRGVTFVIPQDDDQPRGKWLTAEVLNAHVGCQQSGRPASGKPCSQPASRRDVTPANAVSRNCTESWKLSPRGRGGRRWHGEGRGGCEGGRETGLVAADRNYTHENY